MYRFFLISIFCSLAMGVSGQVKAPDLPNPSPITQLFNKEDFEQAEIWLMNKGHSDPTSDLEMLKVPYQNVGVQKGLRMVSLTECTLRLEDQAGLISYAFLSNDNYRSYKNIHDFISDLHRGQKPAYLELNIPLYDLSYKKGKRPRMLSKKPNKPGYNKWAVQIKAKGSLPILFMATHERRTEKIYGEILTFVFDNEAQARRFDSDLRNAIRVCKDFEPAREPEI